MSFTKVAPAGIGTEPGNSILIGDSLLHSTGIDIGRNTGIGVTIRKHGDATFTGIITASAFFGDGSGLEGVSSSGIGTPLSDDDTSELNKVYYVNQELSIGSTVTVNHPDSAIASYTHYQDLVVKDNADFIVSDGDTFIPDVLGINTASLPNPVSGATGGRIRAGTITNAGANGAPNFPNGLTGTAGTFTGAINAASGTITGNLGVGGVLTYEDVTNVDSIGIVTARLGINLVGNDLNVGSNIKIGNASGIVTATSFSGDGSALTGVGASFGNSSVNSAGIATFSAFVPTAQGSLSHRNIIVNGDMRIAQRGTSSTSSGYHTVDRFKYTASGVDNAPTQSQSDVAAGTTPYTLGFRKAYKITNANQTSVGVSDRIRLEVNLEAQDIANSGWNYKDPNSFITLSFWCKSSVAQNFYANIRTPDGSSQQYSFETGSLTADTWTKVIKTIPGNSNLTFDNNAELGWNMDITMFMGTDNTTSGNTMNQWYAYVSQNQMPDNTSTWYLTNNATWEITGMQLEVGSVATPFEHRSFGEELARCQRYCVQYNSNNANRDYIMPAKVSDSDDAYTAWQPPVAPRTTYPSISVSNTSHLCLAYGDGYTNSPVNFSSRDNTTANPFSPIVFLNFDLNNNVLTAGDMVFLAFSNNTTGGYVRFEWEL